MKTLYRGILSPAHVSRLFSILILASLLLSVLPALAPPGAGAQGDGATAPSGEVQESEEPTPIPEGEGSEEPPPAPEGEETSVPEPEPEAQQGGVATFIAEARSCPPGFDPSAGDASAALAGCTEPLAGIAFTLGTQNPNYPGDTRTTGTDGVAAWSDIPLGTAYAVTEAVPQGAGDPWVYCEVTGGPGADQYSFFLAAGGRMDVGLTDPNLASYGQTYCRWFNVQSGDPVLALTPDAASAIVNAEIHISNALCPVNYNTADMTLGALKAACTTAGDGFSFTLKASRGAARTGTTDAQGVVAWTDVPSGKLTITETVPEGYQYAQPYCSVAPVGSPAGSPSLSLVESDGKKISGEIASGQALHCQLFNIPQPESTVAVYPMLCPSTYNTADMTLGALSAGCGTAGTNIDYTVAPATGESFTGSTGEQGYLRSPGFRSGSVTIEETVPPGFLLGAVYCDATPPQGELGGTGWTMPKVEGGVVTADIPDRYSLSCYLFHIWNKTPGVPTGADAYVINLISYLCPADAVFETAADVANNSQLCKGTPGWTLEYAGEGFSQTVTTDPVGATTVGSTTIGRYTITTSPSEESVPAALWCTYNGGPLHNMLGWGQEVFYYPTKAGDVLNCQWFHTQVYPEGTTVSITIEKYLCGPEYPDDVVVEEWRAACTDPEPSVTFEVEQYSGAVETGTTGEDGIVTLQVEPGNVVILPTPPTSQANGYAWCGAAPAGAAPEYVNAGRLSAGEYGMPLTNVKPALAYTCYWLTVPARALTEAPEGGETESEQESGSAVVFKWRCPEGFDAAGASADDLFTACSTAQPGITIGVADSAGESFTQPTRFEKGPAVARFSGIAPGEISIGELGPDGHELTRVLCNLDDAPAQEALGKVQGYFDHPVTNGTITTTVEAGKQLTCNFFNVPADTGDSAPKAGAVSFTTMICPPGYAATQTNYIGVLMQCATEAGVEFKLTQGETELVAVGRENGVATFANAEAGALRISAYPREGYDQPLVFCRATPEGGGALGELVPVTVDNWAITYDLPEGSYLGCLWANMPGASTSTDPAKATLQAYVCPEGTGEYQLIDTLMATCTAQPEGVKFTVGQAFANPKEGATDSTGRIVFSDVAPVPEYHQITEVGGQGHKPLAAWCWYEGPSGTTQLSRHAAAPLYLYLTGGVSVECMWFSVPFIEPAQVDITMRICPADFNPVDATNDRIRSECTDKPAGIEFRVENGSTLNADPASEIYGVTLATNEDGEVSFEEIPEIPLRISELSPGYQTVAVNCGTATKGESPSSYTSLAILEDGVASTATPYTVVTCYWAMVPPPPVDLGIHVSSCLPYYEFDVATLDYLTLNCTPKEGVDMQVAAGEGAYETTVKTSVAGLAVFEKVPSGTLTMIEASPDLRTVRVFCGTATSGYVSVDFMADRVDNISTSENVTCYWFTIDATQSRITLYKHACPDDYVPAGQTYDELWQACPAPLEGVRFDFDATGQNYDVTDDEGIAGINGISPGQQTITETPPAGYAGAVVFCREVAPGQPEPGFVLTLVDEFTITSEVEGGNLLECHWFNTKVDYAKVDIHKYGCHGGYLPQGHSYETVLEKCTTPLQGVPFTLGGPAVELSNDTDASGRVRWEGIPPGPLFISETPPAGYTGAAVYCAVNPDRGPDGTFEQVSVEQFAIEQEVEGGETLACFWFNYTKTTPPGTPSPSPSPTPIPTSTPIPGTGKPGTPTSDPDAPATLILTTFTCPEGYDLFDRDADLAEDCDEPADEIMYSLTTLDEDSAPASPDLGATTDADGVATFAQLAPGPWLLIESLPEDTLTAFIASCSSTQHDLEPDNPFTPFAYLGSDGQLGVTVLPGETLACDVYNVPEEEQTDNEGA